MSSLCLKYSLYEVNSAFPPGPEQYLLDYLIVFPIILEGYLIFKSKVALEDLAGMAFG